MLTVRQLGFADLAVARELFLLFQSDDGIAEPRVPADQYLRKILKKKYFYAIAALDGERVAGGLTAYSLPMYKKEIREMFLFEIGVTPTYRRRSVGKQLVEYLLALCRREGIGVMFVVTSRENMAAVRLYETTGGSADARSILYTYGEI